MPIPITVKIPCEPFELDPDQIPDSAHIHFLYVEQSRRGGIGNFQDDS